MSYLRYTWLLADSSVQRILCCALVCLSWPCEHYVASFSGLYLCIAPLVFSNVYLGLN